MGHMYHKRPTQERNVKLRVDWSFLKTYSGLLQDMFVIIGYAFNTNDKLYMREHMSNVYMQQFIICIFIHVYIYIVHRCCIHSKMIYISMGI